MARRRFGGLWWVAFLAFFVVLALVAALIALALNFQARPAPLWIALWLALALAALAVGLRRGLVLGTGLALAGVLPFAIWWTTILPSNDRDWQPEVAELVRGSIDAADPDRITLENVRDFRWLTPTTAEERWETRSYDLATLTSTDVIMTYWMGPEIAHVMVSFGFADGDYLAFSVGIRPAQGQVYSSLAGFFKDYELIVTAGDERDLIGLRATVQTQNTSVQLYRVALPPELARDLFREYVGLANAMAERPRFYRTLLANCTTVIWGLVRRIDPGLPLDWRVILSGYLDGYLYDRRALDMRYTLPELQAMSHLPRDVQLTLDSRAWSAAIRAGIPPL
jgi:hypothetical protein